MLFPVTPEYEKMRKEQDEKVLEEGVEGVEDVIYFKQTSASRFSPSACIRLTVPFPQSRTHAGPSRCCTLSQTSMCPSVRSSSLPVHPVRSAESCFARQRKDRLRSSSLSARTRYMTNRADVPRASLTVLVSTDPA